MAIVGGLRDRLIFDNLENLIKDSLDAKGWFDSGRRHGTVKVRGEPIARDEEIKPNVVALTDITTNISAMEMGSRLDEYRWEYVVDIFAESEAVLKSLNGDIRAILEGKFNSIGRVGPTFDVLDLRQATPTKLFSCEIENIATERSNVYSKPFERYWRMIFFEVVDHLLDEEE